MLNIAGIYMYRGNGEKYDKDSWYTFVLYMKGLKFL